MFRNCLKFHENGSEFYSHGKSLEEILDKFLEQWLPEYAYESFEKEDFTKYKPQPSTSTGKKRKHPAEVHEELAKKKHKKSKKGKKNKKHKKRGRHAKDDLEEEDVDSEMDGSFESEDSELSTGEQLDLLGKFIVRQCWIDRSLHFGWFHKNSVKLTDYQKWYDNMKLI